MSVIIDQFEVVLDSQQERDSKVDNNGAATTPENTLKPQDITAVVEQYSQRCERVRAH